MRPMRRVLLVAICLAFLAGLLATWLLWGNRPREVTAPSATGRETEQPAEPQNENGPLASRPRAITPTASPASAPESAPESGPAAARATGVGAGRVIDTLGDPVSGALVRATGSLDDTVEHGRATTGPDGTFRIEGLPFVGLQFRATAARRTMAIEYLSLTAAEPVGMATLRLWDAGVVRGRVVDAGGAAVVGATVIAAPHYARVLPYVPLAETTSGEEGRFELGGVPLGPVWIRAAARSHGLGGEMVRLRDSSEVVVRLPDGGVDVAVKVEGLEDAGAAKVNVVLMPYDGGYLQVFPPAVVRGVIGEGGEWKSTGLPDHDYSFFIHAEGWSFQPQRLSVKKGAGPHAVTFKATRNGAIRLRGVLHDETGRVLPGETVQCRASSVIAWGTGVTGVDGGFSIPVPVSAGMDCSLTLVGSRYTLIQKADAGGANAGSEARIRSRYDVKVDPDVPLDLCAVPEARVRGKVVTASGAAARHVRVSLQSPKENRMPRWMDFASTKTDGEGRFEFTGLLEAPDVRASVESEAGSGTSEALALGRGGQVEVTISLAAPAIIEGAVRDRSGQPVPGARVWLRNWDLDAKRQRDGGVVEALTDAHGRYRHLGVAPGGHWLECFLDRGGRRGHEDQEKFEVAPGARIQRDLVLPDG
jgi:hypothetical protein